MVDRTIAVRLRAEVADFKRGMADAAKAVDKNVSSIDSLSSHVGLLGGALTGFAALAVSRFAAFDKQMSSVQAATRATGAELDSLRQEAIRAGADTAFSATEAAAGIEELAKAGVSTADILGGGLTGALNLAAAGNLEVADAAQIAAVSLKQFNLDGSDVSHIADLLAAGAGKAVGSVSDLSQALNQSGLIASQTGLSIEETTAGLSAFASAGLLGSDAGTSFKTMLQVLAAPSSTAAAEMERLGINAYDAQGNFIGLEGLAGNLKTSLAGLTVEQKNSALATIFGSDAVRAASVLYSEGSLGIQQWTDAVNQQGYAAEQARIQSDNLMGDLERLGGSLDTVFIQSGSGANDSLRMIVQGAEAAIDAIGRIPAPVLSVTTAIAGSGGLALLGVAGLGKLAVGFSEAKQAAEQLGISTKTAAVAAGGLGTVLAGVGIGLSIMATRAAESQGRVEQLAQTWTDVGEATTATNNLINESLTKNTDNMVDGNRTLIELADQVGVSTQDLIGYIEGEADAIERVDGKIAAHNDITGEWIGKALGQQTEAKNLKSELGTLSEEYTRSKEVSELDARAKGAGADATDELAGATEDATGALADNTEAIEENWQALLDASGAVLSLRDAQNRAEAAYDDAREAIKDNGKTLDVTTEKGRSNRSALDDIASSGWDVVDSMRANGDSQKSIQGAMSTTRDRFIATAQAMGLSKSEARNLANELGLIPKNVSSKVSVNTGSALSEIDQVRRALAGVNSKTVSIVLNTVRNEGRNHGGLATGGRLPGFPTGGRLPGTPPGNPMQDNLLGVDGSGMPKVRVRSREWVVSQPAADYYGDGIMGALNARAIPREALSELPGLASGGAVQAARSDVLRTQRALEAARRSFRRVRSERNQDRWSAAQEAAEAARERYERVREEAASLRTDLRRGNIRDQVTGGLSGAQGATDQMRDLAASGDLSRRGSSRLAGSASKAEGALTVLYKQAERLEKKVADTTANFEKWKGIADGVSSSISGGFSLGGVTGGTDPWSGAERTATGSQLLSAAKAYEAKAKTLVLRLQALRKAGYGTAILQEVAAQGVEGGTAMADALLTLSPADMKALQSSMSEINRYGDRAGAEATGGNLSSAARAKELAEAQAAAIEARIGKWAEWIGAVMAKSLGISARASGGPISAGSPYLVGEQGPELILPRQSGYVVNAQRTASMTAGPQKVVNVYVTQNYPQAIPYQKGINKALQHAAEEVVG